MIDLPNSEKLYKHEFYIPSVLTLTKAQIKEVSEILHRVLI
jgi:dTDP-4-amino-4,6-dideoxygalactose transaminase